MIAEERRRKLMVALSKRGALSVAAASDLLGVSRMTVHRDLDALAAAGLLRKVHGGAVPIIAVPARPDIARPFTERQPAHAVAKEKIARHLAKVLAGARSLALDASSTVFCLAAVLKPLPGGGPSIVTNSVPLFQELQRRRAGFRVALTGGEPHPRTGSLVGPLVLRSVEGLHFDVAVFSAAGVMMETGTVYESTPEDAAVKQAFLARADRAILAVDKTKINFLAPYTSAVLRDFDLFVTEDGPQEVKKRRPALVRR
ncbi:MAG: DeoR/GlpR family DNA-binding transcription regulator [Planctomycetota bacterium]|nr:DeoR/GlpR family DNA-binding transcription regulator [Planctomycetota bacterium]